MHKQTETGSSDHKIQRLSTCPTNLNNNESKAQNIKIKQMNIITPS